MEKQNISRGAVIKIVGDLQGPERPLAVVKCSSGGLFGRPGDGFTRAFSRNKRIDGDLTVTDPVVENIKIPRYNVGLMETEERTVNVKGARGRTSAA